MLVAAVAVSTCKRQAPVVPVATSVPVDARGGSDADVRARPAPADVCRPPLDAQKTPSGILTRVIQPGAGTRHPTGNDYVEVFYAGWTRKGQFFEGTGEGERIRLDRAQLIPGLGEGIGLMVEGEKRRFWIPLALAYGARPGHVNAPREDMTFDVELLRIVPIPARPDDVAKPPKNALRTKSGLVYRYLKHGMGAAHPTPATWVSLEYSLWTGAGRCVHSSRINGDSVRFPMMDLFPGWYEAMLLMVQGDKLRLWLPGKLAYGDPTPGQEPLPYEPPPGPLVMDVELVKIDN
jgi:peptidylprolyl isomerase